MAMRTTFLLMGLSALTATAQKLPQPSPSSIWSQSLGLTEISADYSRPSAKGRVIFGELVPYGELWRTGANRATIVRFSTEVEVNRIPVAAGSYSLLTIPGKTEWTVILNRDTTLAGTDGYDRAKDVLRTTVKSKPCAFTETFTFELTDLSTTSAHLKVQWAETSVSVPVKVEVRKRAQQNIEKAIAEQPGDWRVYRNAANYYHNEGIQYPKAVEYIDRSIELKSDNWYSHWLRAQLLYKTKKTADAKMAAQKSIELGEAQAAKDGSTFGYKAFIEGEMKGWK